MSLRLLQRWDIILNSFLPFFESASCVCMLHFFVWLCAFICESVLFVSLILVSAFDQVEEGWWEGFLNGKIGMFPSNFTKEVQTESDTPSLDTSQEELRNNRTSKIQEKKTITTQTICLYKHNNQNKHSNQNILMWFSSIGMFFVN